MHHIWFLGYFSFPLFTNYLIFFLIEMNFIDEWKLAIGTKMPMISRPLLKPCAIKTRRENSERKKKENYKPIIESKFIKIAMITFL